MTRTITYHRAAEPPKKRTRKKSAKLLQLEQAVADALAKQPGVSLLDNKEALEAHTRLMMHLFHVSRMLRGKAEAKRRREWEAQSLAEQRRAAEAYAKEQGFEVSNGGGPCDA